MSLKKCRDFFQGGTLGKCKDMFLGVVMLAFSGFYFYNATQIKTRPKLTPSYSNARIIPELLGILLAIMSVLLIIQGIKKMRDHKADTSKKKLSRDDLISVILTFAIIIAYTLMLDKGFGFCLSTIIYLFLQILILSPKAKRNYLLFAIVAVVFTGIVFFAFRIGLQQLLPRGPIESLLGY